MIERFDAEHLDFALRQGRVLFSFNRGDFLRLHSQYLAMGNPHAGLILARQQQYSVGDQMRRILRLIATESAEDMQTWVEFLSDS